jgi:formylmethanofuran dehydrogenase subunit E
MLTMAETLAVISVLKHDEYLKIHDYQMKTKYSLQIATQHYLEKYYKISKNKELMDSFGDIRIFELIQYIQYIQKKQKLVSLKGEKMSYKMITCKHCGKKVRDYNTKILDEEIICKDCFEELTERCHVCHSIHKKDKMIKLELDTGETVYVDNYCRRNYFAKCDICGKYHLNRHSRLKTIRVNSDSATQTVCEKCLKDIEEKENITFRQCDYCGVYVNQDTLEDIDGMDVCDNCADYHTITCYECGERHLSSNIYYDEEDGEHYCKDCFVRGSILAYHSNLVEFETLKSDSNDNRTFGFELEVAGNRYRAREFSEFFNGEMVMMYDSSVDGFEIVTMPMDLKYMYDNFFPKLEKGLKFLKRNGFRGHNHGGLHIHVSENQIDEKTAAQLKQILYGNDYDKDIWLAIAQRQRGEMSEWASMSGSYGFQTVYSGSSKKVAEARHTALNYDDRTRTYEFRIFNSSLRIDRIIKNIECVLALVDYSKKYKDYKSPVCTTAGFIEYVLDNKDKYKVLYDFLQEKNIKINYGEEIEDDTEDELEVV